MSKVRVSVVQYLNAAPLVWGFSHGLLVEEGTVADMTGATSQREGW
jgi:hypothetical protein